MVLPALPSSPTAPRVRRCAACLPADTTPDGVALWSPVIEIPAGAGGLAGTLRVAARRLLPFFGPAGRAVIVLEVEASAEERVQLVDARWGNGIAELAHNGHVISRVVLPIRAPEPLPEGVTVGRVPTTLARSALVA